MSEFNAVEMKDHIVAWLKEWERNNGQGCNMIVGISGGKDSSTVAALCVEAFGKDRVIGVLMPDGEQDDIEYAYKLCNHLGIRYIEVNISGAVASLIKSIYHGSRDSRMTRNYGFEANENKVLSEQAHINLPARIRMCTLYAISQTNNGRVLNTCNLSEDFIGYASRYGDSAGDVAPIAGLTVQEVKAVGRVLGLPEELIEKTPSDGLCGKTDEDNLGFTYEVLDRYIRTGEIDDIIIKEKIDSMHLKNKFKLEPMPHYEPAAIDVVY